MARALGGCKCIVRSCAMWADRTTWYCRSTCGFKCLQFCNCRSPPPPPSTRKQSSYMMYQMSLWSNKVRICSHRENTLKVFCCVCVGGKSSVYYSTTKPHPHTVEKIGTEMNLPCGFWNRSVSIYVVKMLICGLHVSTYTAWKSSAANSRQNRHNLVLIYLQKWCRLYTTES